MAASVDDDHSHGDALDPVFLHARREAGEILLAWLAALLWSVGYCSFRGYGQTDPLQTVLGIPAWVFWGIAVPWAASAIFTFYFSLVRMKDDPLGEQGRDPPLKVQPDAAADAPPPEKPET